MGKLEQFIAIVQVGVVLLNIPGCAAPRNQVNDMAEKNYEISRSRMVADQIEQRGVTDSAVLEALRMVPRHAFVPAEMRSRAYDDAPLPIGQGQTISQPYIVALMTELARVDKSSIVLEIGTGSGYQAAVLSVLVKKVCTIEYVESLGMDARERLRQLKYDNVDVRIGDGYNGWPEPVQFDAILITAAINHIPPALLLQLRPGGRLVVPLGEHGDTQWLTICKKKMDGNVETEKSIPVQFVPFVHMEAQKPKR
jgi:protein-L-isoaspartate(D-aspartate) O-methyltransferase